MRKHKVTLAPTQWGRGQGEGAFGVERCAFLSPTADAAPPPHPNPLPHCVGAREEFFL